MRLFKYVVGQHYEDFVTSSNTWARRTVSVAPAGLSALPQTIALQQLYTEHVVPPAVLCHVADVETFSEAKREDVTSHWQSFLVTLGHAFRTLHSLTWWSGLPPAPPLAKRTTRATSRQP